MIITLFIFACIRTLLYNRADLAICFCRDVSLHGCNIMQYQVQLPFPWDTISVLCDGYIVPSCFWLFAYQDMQHPEENFKNKSSFHHHWKRKLWESKWFSYRMLPLMFQTLEGDRKLCREFKFSYIGNTGRENFCSWFSFVLCEEIWAYVYLCKS